jgi:hypothetical protein
MFAHLMNVNHLLDGSHSRRFFYIFSSIRKTVVIWQSSCDASRPQGRWGQNIKRANHPWGWGNVEGTKHPYYSFNNSKF